MPRLPRRSVTTLCLMVGVAAVFGLASCASVLGVGGPGQGAGAATATPVAPGTMITVPATAPPATAPPPPSIPSAPAKIGVAADGGRLRMRVGRSRVVELPTASVAGNWLPLKVSAGGVVGVSQSGGYPSRAPVVATVTAERRGSVVLSSQTDADCFHHAPRCLMPVRAWSITVIVV